MLRDDVQRERSDTQRQWDQDRLCATNGLLGVATLYAIQAGTFGPIKIGITKDVPLRLVELQVGNHENLTLLGTIGDGHCGPSDERRYHNEWQAYRIRGEWFKPAYEIFETIRKYGRVIAEDFAQKRLMAKLASDVTGICPNTALVKLETKLGQVHNEVAIMHDRRLREQYLSSSSANVISRYEQLKNHIHSLQIANLGLRRENRTYKLMLRLLGGTTRSALTRSCAE